MSAKRKSEFEKWIKRSFIVHGKWTQSEMENAAYPYFEMRNAFNAGRRAERRKWQPKANEATRILEETLERTKSRFESQQR